eukprot:IDg13399t1
MPGRSGTVTDMYGDIDTAEERASVVEVEAAIVQYTAAVERRLKPGLDTACERRDRLFAELARVDRVWHTLDVLEESSTGDSMIETRANLGEEFYAAAVVNLGHPFVLDVGAGVLVEANKSEALRMLSDRKQLLDRLADAATAHIVAVQAHIKAVLSSIARLRAAHPSLTAHEERADVLADDD